VLAIKAKTGRSLIVNGVDGSQFLNFCPSAVHLGADKNIFIVPTLLVGIPFRRQHSR